MRLQVNKVSKALNPATLALLQITEKHIESLYDYAKFRFECGAYSEASEYLYNYRTLAQNPDRLMGAMWGKLAAEILTQNWDAAMDELNKMKDLIDSKVVGCIH